MPEDLVVVTGGCGFIGSEVVRLLVEEQGRNVRIVDDLSKSAATPHPDADFRQVDLTDGTSAREAIDGAKTVIHMAAKIGGIGYFHRIPATILSENNKLLSAVFEGSAAEKVDRIVYVSSSMVFERATRFPSREEDLDSIPPPITAYGASKLSGEWYCKAFHDEYGLPYTIVRPFNAYGINEHPGEEPGEAHVIPDLVRKLLDGQDPLEILGDGEQTRCFTHVRDVAGGILAAAFHPAGENEDFNISTPEETRIADLSGMLWRLCGREGEARLRSVEGFPHDIRRRIPSVEKAKRVLGWEARIRLADGLRDVVEWLRRADRTREASG